jgi:uncharacterized phiE125 gp8 family phage protein
MALSLVTGPSVEPVTLAEAKVHLRQDVADEDALITTLITAARQWTETFTHRALITQTWDLKLDDFPCDNADLELPLAPVASVTSISYVDTTGATQTWSASSYQTDLPTGPQAQRGRIAPAYAQYYPVPRSQLNAVTVRFVAGYGATGGHRAGVDPRRDQADGRPLVRAPHAGAHRQPGDAAAAVGRVAALAVQSVLS